MNIEEQTFKNTDDIAKVTAAVSELAATMKFELERSKEYRESVKSMVSELRGINEKLGSLAVVQNKIAELESKVAVLENKEDTCKEWRDKHDGATDAMRVAVKAMWAVCGTGVMSVAGFVLYLFFTNTTPVLTHQPPHEVISGE